MASTQKKKALKKTTSNKSLKPQNEKKGFFSSFFGNNEGFIPLFTLVGGLLLAVFYYIPEGFFGSVIRDFSTGLFGWPVYILPILLIVNGIHKSSKSYEAYSSKYVYTTIGLACLCVFSHILFVEKQNPLSFSGIASYYTNGVDCVGGGLFGGFIADSLRALIGQVASFIVALTAIVMVTMKLFSWSPVKLMLRGVIKAYMRLTGKRFKIPAANKRKEKPTQMSVGDNGEVEFVNFSDDDIGIDEKPKRARAKKVAKDEKEDLPWSDEDIFSGLDEMIDNAIPATPVTFDEPAKSNVKSSYEAVTGTSDPDAHQLDTEADEMEFSEPKYVDAPEKLTGMEDVSEEMESAFERIPYTFPSLSLLNDPKGGDSAEDLRYELRETAQKLISILKSFGIDAKPMGCSKGPAVTRYEIALDDGVKVSKLSGLSNDLALRLAVPSVIIAPVPGKDAVGIEIPNQKVNMVHIKEVLASNEFNEHESNLAFAMGKDISGKNIICDISRMPHLLIAGSTGSGKSVCINALITSLIYKSDPNDVKLIMVDPKMVELGIYNGIPHLLIPVVTEPRRASGALYWAVQEMLRRYKEFADNSVRTLKGYNDIIKANGSDETLPHIVIIVDELADLMMVAPKEVEESICRLAQMGRAAGIHLVIATQRPSRDVITGLIKTNIPSRIAFAVSSAIDSRIILDEGGADKLLGRGDMLFKPIGATKPTRIQCAYIDDSEVERVVEFIKEDGPAHYNEDVIEKIDAGKPVNVTDEFADPNDADELLAKAVEIAVDTGKISASHLQRRLKVGFSRAARIIDQMEERGIVSPPDGSKPREVLITKDEFLEMSLQ